MARPSEATPTPDSYRGPGYPLLVALAMRVGGDDNWIRVLLVTQALLGALSVALVIAIARMWLSFAFAIAAGTLLAVWPHTVSLAGLFLTETFFGFTLLLGIWLLGWATRSHSTYKYTLAGLVFGYAALINPAIVLFPVLVAALILSRHRTFALVFLVAALSLPGGWAVRGAMLDTGRTSGDRLMENVLAGMEPDFDYLDTPPAMEARARMLSGLQAYENGELDLLDRIVTRFEADPAGFAKWYLIGKPERLWQWMVLGHKDIYVYRVLVSPFQVQPLYRGIASLCYSLNPWLLGASLGFVIVLIIGTFRHGLRDTDIPPALVALLFVYATALHSILTPDPRYATPFRSFEILLALSLLAWAVGRTRGAALERRAAT